MFSRTLWRWIFLIGLAVKLYRVYVYHYPHGWS
jgi:hypothetical protein